MKPEFDTRPTWEWSIKLDVWMDDGWARVVVYRTEEEVDKRQKPYCHLVPRVPDPTDLGDAIDFAVRSWGHSVGAKWPDEEF